MDDTCALPLDDLAYTASVSGSVRLGPPHFFSGVVAAWTGREYVAVERGALRLTPAGAPSMGSAGTIAFIPR